MKSNWTLQSLALAVVIVGALALPALAQGDDTMLRQHEVLKQKIATTRIDLVAFEDTDFGDAIESIKTRTGVNLVIDPKVAADVEEEPVTLRLRNVTIKSALEILTDYVKLKYTFRHGVIWITSPEEAMRGITVVRIYDVRDLTMKIKNFPGTRIRLRGNDGGDGGGPIFEDEDEPVEPLETDELVDIIPQFTGGESWDLNPEASITQVMGLLVIRQSPETHVEIAQLLAQLRANR